jgi:hypothetical protein
MADAGVSAFAMEVMPHHPRAGDGVLSQRDEAQSVAPLVGYTPPDSFP